MNPALSTSGLARIREFVGGRSLLAFDIDGTLAPIVARPWDAHIPDELQVRLAALTATRTVAIITGRAIADAKPMLGFSPRYLIGNHGAEGVTAANGSKSSVETTRRGARLPASRSRTKPIPSHFTIGRHSRARPRLGWWRNAQRDLFLCLG